MSEEALVEHCVVDNYASDEVHGQSEDPVCARRNSLVWLCSGEKSRTTPLEIRKRLVARYGLVSRCLSPRKKMALKDNRDQCVDCRFPATLHLISSFALARPVRRIGRARTCRERRATRPYCMMVHNRSPIRYRKIRIGIEPLLVAPSYIGKYLHGATFKC